MTRYSGSTLSVAPAQVIRGVSVASGAVGDAIASLGRRPLVVGGDRGLALVQPQLTSAQLQLATANYGGESSEAALEDLSQAAVAHQADVIIGVGGGKALDIAKLLAHRRRLPVVTIPTSAATCAAWTALSNVYSDQGAFLYDVALDRCPDLLILDYELVQTAPVRTLVAGIGDALAKWYEASVSSGDSDQTLVIAAVQQARVLRDILFQKTAAALTNVGGSDWREVVDAAVLMAGVIGGLGGAQCRTVAAHAVHNGLTHLAASHGTLHGEKVAYGILVQLRLEEMGQRSALATAARQQLVQFYKAVGLPTSLEDLGMGHITIAELHHAAQVACRAGSDIHHLPFTVDADALAAAMVSPQVAELRPTTVDDVSPQEVQL